MIKFKKKIQFYFKRFFQLVFMLIYGKIKYKNNVITSKNIKVVRPGTGLHPKFFSKVLGKKSRKKLFKINQLVQVYL